MNTKQPSNSRTRFLVGVALFFLAALIAFAVLRKPNSVDQPIRVGVLMPLTGDRGSYGVAMRDAIDLAVEEINLGGGLLGQQIALIVEDTKSTPREGLNAFEKLSVQDHVGIVIGPMSSAEVLSVAPTAESRKVLLFTPSASSPNITAAGDYIFRNVPSDVYEGSAMASVAATNLKLKSVAILQINSDYGYGVVKEFKEGFERLGGAVSLVEAYPDGSRDFRTSLLKIKEANPQAVLFVGYKEMGVAVSQAREIGLTQQFLSTAIFEDHEILEASGKAAEGLVFTSITFDPANPSARAQAFVAAYEKMTGRKPDGYAASAYDAAHIIATAIRTAKTGDSSAVKDALYNLPAFDGLIGKTQFDRNGDAILPIKLKRVRDGKFESFIP